MNSELDEIAIASTVKAGHRALRVQIGNPRQDHATQGWRCTYRVVGEPVRRAHGPDRLAARRSEAWVRSWEFRWTGRCPTPPIDPGKDADLQGSGNALSSAVDDRASCPAIHADLTIREESWTSPS